jgi:hypothetical protein
MEAILNATEFAKFDQSTDSRRGPGCKPFASSLPPGCWPAPLPSAVAVIIVMKGSRPPAEGVDHRPALTPEQDSVTELAAGDGRCKRQTCQWQALFVRPRLIARVN